MDITHIVRAAAATAWICGAIWLITTVGSALVAAWRDTRRTATSPVRVGEPVSSRTRPARDAA